MVSHCAVCKVPSISLLQIRCFPERKIPWNVITRLSKKNGVWLFWYEMSYKCVILFIPQAYLCRCCCVAITLFIFFFFVQELLSFYLELRTGKNEPEKLPHKPSLSRNALQFLQKTLLHSPALGHCLIFQLVLPGNVRYQTSNQSLQKLYATCVRDLLAEIRKNIANGKEGTSEFLSGVENFQKILARWNSQSHTGDNQTERMFLDILDLISKVNNQLVISSVMPSLLASKTSTLAQAYSVMQQRKVFNDLVKGDAIVERTHLGDCSLRTQLLVALALEHDRRRAWENYIALVQGDQLHLLGEILVSIKKWSAAYNTLHVTDSSEK